MRFSDDISKSVTPDFVPRKHNKPIARLLTFHVVTILVAAACIYFIPSQAQHFAGIIIITSLIGLAVYNVLSNQQNNDMRMATEFENMLFSAATSLGSSFCFFIKRDGTVVYSDDGTQNMFPRFAYEEGRALDSLLKEGNVEKSDIDRIYSALSSGNKERLVFPISQSDRTRAEFIIMVEPLRRPAGYFVIRGRPYHPERTDSVKVKSPFGLASQEKVGALLEQLPTAVYITDTLGSIEYCNPALEKELGYAAGHIVDEKFTLMKIIYEADGYSTNDFGVMDFSGTVLLQHRNSSLSKARLTQYLIRDEEGKVSGCCALLDYSDMH